jgi:pilus assembly protein Flp/PilA
MRWQRQRVRLAVSMARSLIGFLRDDSGATAIEYSLILGLVVLAIVGSINLLSDSLSNMYMFVSSSVTGVVNGG